MDENIKLEAQIYIKNNCKLYKNYFYLKNTNTVVNRAVKILEKKLLNINTFCYYLSSTFDEMNHDLSYYCNLSKAERKQLDFFQNSFIKIYMHIDFIFNEINNLKKRIEQYS